MSSIFTRKKGVVSTILVLVFLMIMLFPFYIMIIGALKRNAALMRMPPDIGPFTDLVLTNFDYVIRRSDIGLWFFNSLTVSLGVAAGAVFIASCAGYAFAKIRFKGRGVFFAIVVATMILPKQIMLIPNFLVALNLGLPNTRFGVILTTIAPPFGVFLCRQFMAGIPTELIQASEIDGCGELRKFLSIVVPLSLPAMGALAIFSFFSAYNDYLWQLIMISDRKLMTVSVGISFFADRANTNFGYQLMAASLCTIPLVVLFLMFQKVFIQGVTLGGVKG